MPDTIFQGFVRFNVILPVKCWAYNKMLSKCKVGLTVIRVSSTVPEILKRGSLNDNSM